MTNVEDKIRTLVLAAGYLEDDVLGSNHFMSQCKRDLVSNTAHELREMAEKFREMINK